MKDTVVLITNKGMGKADETLPSVGGMSDIIEAQVKAEKVISLYTS